MGVNLSTIFFHKDTLDDILTKEEKSMFRSAIVHQINHNAFSQIDISIIVSDYAEEYVDPNICIGYPVKIDRQFLDYIGNSVIINCGSENTLIGYPSGY